MDSLQLGTIVRSAIVFSFCILTAALPAEDKATPAGPKELASGLADLSRARIAGTVVDKAGKPMPGIEINIAGHRRMQAPILSDVDGKFTILLKEPNPWNVCLLARSKDGSLQGIYECESEYGITPRKPVQIVISTVSSVKVRVATKEGIGVPEASVFVQESYFAIGSQKTDKDGWAEVRFPAGIGVRRVLAFRAGAGFDYFENYQQRISRVFPPLPDRLELRLDGAKVVSIRAQSPSGAPVPGVVFDALTVQKEGKLDSANVSGIPEFSAISDKEGIAEFDWLPAKSSHVPFFYLNAYSPYVTTDRLMQGRRDAQGVKVEDIVATVTRRVPIRGIVTLPDGKPASGILLRWQGRDDIGTSDQMFVRTRSDGSYSGQARPGMNYVACIFDAAWAMQTKFDVKTPVAEGLETVENFDLIKGTRFHGRVAVSPDNLWQGLTIWENGPPQPGQPRVRRNQQVRCNRPLACDETGSFQIQLAPGVYEVSTSSNPSQREQLIVRNEEEIERNFLASSPPQKIIKGNVVYADTLKPAVGATIQEVELPDRNVENLDANRLQLSFTRNTSSTDKDGSFTHKTTRKRKLLFLTSAHKVYCAGVLVEEGIESKDVDLKKGAHFTGKVVNEKGEPVSHAIVQCNMTVTTGPSQRIQIGFVVSTDELGTYVLRGIPLDTFCRIYAQRVDAQGGRLAVVPGFVASSTEQTTIADLVVK